MTEGSIWGQLLRFSMPILLGLAFQQLYNTVDTIIVGQLVGKEALAAVGSTGSIINMMVGLCAGLSTGSTVVISQNYGARDYKALHDAVHTTMFITFVVGILITGIGILIVNPMLRFMNTPDDVFPQSALYLRIYFGGVSGLVLYNMGSGILRAVGDSKRPLYFLVISSIIHVLLALLFVLKLSMGVDGVAYATIIAQFISGLMVLFVLVRTDGPYRLHWRDIAYEKSSLMRILRVGLPASLQQGLTAFSNVFVQSYINNYGSACMAGWSSYSKVDVFAGLPMQSFSIATATFVAQNYGAKKMKRAKDGVKAALWITLGFTIGLSILVLLFRLPLLSLISVDPDVLYYGEQFILIITPLHFTCSFNQIYAGALRGMGDSRRPMIGMLAGFVAFRQLFLFTNKILGGSFGIMALGYPAGWIFCSLLLFIFYRKSSLAKATSDLDMPPEAFNDGEKAPVES